MAYLMVEGFSSRARIFAEMARCATVSGAATVCGTILTQFVQYDRLPSALVVTVIVVVSRVYGLYGAPLNVLCVLVPTAASAAGLSNVVKSSFRSPLNALYWFAKDEENGALYSLLDELGMMVMVDTP